MTRAHDIAELFRAAFDDDPNFNGVARLADISTLELTLPALIFKVEDKPLNGTGTAYDFTLHVHVDTTADGGAPALTAHTVLIALVAAKLFGAGKAALITALQTPGTFDFLGGWAAVAAAPGIAANHLRTPIALAGTVRVL